MRTIDADDAKKRISALRFELTPHYGRLYEKYWSGYHDGIRDAIDAIDDTPTVEREPGEWIYIDEPMIGNPYGRYKCSECNLEEPSKSDFCPNCGCRMKGADDDQDI